MVAWCLFDRVNGVWVTPWHLYDYQRTLYCHQHFSWQEASWEARARARGRRQLPFWPPPLSGAIHATKNCLYTAFINMFELSLQALNVDSQRGTPVSRESLQSIVVPQYTDPQTRTELDAICKRYSLPPFSAGPCLAPGTITTAAPLQHHSNCI